MDVAKVASLKLVSEYNTAISLTMHSVSGEVVLIIG